jgi:hypothetical protein
MNDQLMGTFAKTANVDYYLSFAEQGKQTSFFRLQKTNRSLPFPFSIYIYVYIYLLKRRHIIYIYLYLYIYQYVQWWAVLQLLRYKVT